MSIMTLSLMALNVVAFSASYEYDEMGRLVAERGSNGQHTQYTYDAEGRRTQIIDGQNRTTTLEYDPLGRLVKQTDAAGGQTTFAYDLGDRVVRVTDPRGLSTTYAHDGLGQMRWQQSPDTGRTTYDYNAAGIHTSVTRNDGSVVYYEHDGLGRLTLSSAEGEIHQFSYDSCSGGKGRLCAVSTPVTATEFAYNAGGQLMSRRDWTTVAGTRTDHTVSYGYDAISRLSAIRYPNGDRVEYGYGVDGRMGSMSLISSGVAQPVIVQANWQATGRRNWLNYGNGLVRYYAYDLDGRLTDMSVREQDHTARDYKGYSYSVNNEINAIIDPIAPAMNQWIGYDALSRLTTLARFDITNRLSYDAGGNHDRYEAGPNVTQYTIDPHSNRVLDYVNQDGARQYQYDALGNRISETAGSRVQTYGYSAYNRMRQSNINGLVTDYVINARGQRVAKSNASTSRYYYAGQNQLMSELTDSTWTNYLWFDGELVGLARNGQLNFVHTDHLGRPDFVTNAGRQTVWKAYNYAYGRSVQQDDIGGLNIGFPGQYYDAESGLWYNGFRDYDASIARYLQSDPIGLLGGNNTYAYAESNPVSNTDALGLQARAVLRQHTPGTWSGSDPDQYGGPYIDLRSVAAGSIGFIGKNVFPVVGITIVEMGKDGSESKPDNCPTGTLPIDKAKGKLGLDKDAVHGIKKGVGAGPRTWTGIDPSGNVWTGGVGGSGENHGHYGPFLPGGVP